MNYKDIIKLTNIEIPKQKLDSLFGDNHSRPKIEVNIFAPKEKNNNDIKNIDKKIIEKHEEQIEELKENMILLAPITTKPFKEELKCSIKNTNTSKRHNRKTIYPIKCLKWKPKCEYK
jgi:hypothetical protein